MLIHLSLSYWTLLASSHNKLDKKIVAASLFIRILDLYTLLSNFVTA
ncbi:hypothetical protein ENHYDAX1_60126 [Enhydrobacter sp. AX1]|nr:hypothetical protein ENHYDAX1_60126 [Enhydrobacter sp. AX1]